MAKKRKGTVQYSSYPMNYEVRELKGSRYGASLYMKLTRASANKFKYMGNVHPSISYNAIKQHARDYLIQLGMIEPRY